MRRPQKDDWGPSFGDDPEPVVSTPETFKDTTGSLLSYFKDRLPTDSWGRLNSPINGPALIKGFRKLKGNGYTGDQIRGMIDIFIADIVRKPLPQDVAPWRGFLANLDSLAGRLVATATTESYDDVTTDRRL